MIHDDYECELYFLRHGQSVSNVTPDYVTGLDHDSPLTPLGLEQARALGRRLARECLEFDRVYSSTMTRAVQTTEAMLGAMGQPGRAFTRVKELIEQQMPGWRGVLAEEVFTPERLAYIRGKGRDFVPPGGESLRVVQRRVAGWLERELIYNQELVAEGRSLTVAIVGHGAATKSLLQYIMGFDDRLIMRMGMENCSISRFIFNREGWHVVCINDATHVNGLAAAPEEGEEDRRD